MMEIRRGCELIGNIPPFYSKCTKDVALGEDKLPSYQPKLTFIAVQKRHKVRIFVNNGNDGVGKVTFFKAKVGLVSSTSFCDHFCFIF